VEQVVPSRILSLHDYRHSFWPLFHPQRILQWWQRVHLINQRPKLVSHLVNQLHYNLANKWFKRQNLKRFTNQWFNILILKTLINPQWVNSLIKKSLKTGENTIKFLTQLNIKSKMDQSMGQYNKIGKKEHVTSWRDQIWKDFNITFVPNHNYLPNKILLFGRI